MPHFRPTNDHRDSYTPNTSTCGFSRIPSQRRREIQRFHPPKVASKNLKMATKHRAAQLSRLKLPSREATYEALHRKFHKNSSGCDRKSRSARGPTPHPEKT